MGDASESETGSDVDDVFGREGVFEEGLGGVEEGEEIYGEWARDVFCCLVDESLAAVHDALRVD